MHGSGKGWMIDSVSRLSEGEDECIGVKWWVI